MQSNSNQYQCTDNGLFLNLRKVFVMTVALISVQQFINGALMRSLITTQKSFRN